MVFCDTSVGKSKKKGQNINRDGTCKNSFKNITKLFPKKKNNLPMCIN